MSTRGVRNNNPGNIDRNPANKWQGRMRREQMTPEQRAEKRFEVFSSPAWGIRAMCVLLINYFDRHGCNNVRKIINRWAPPVENNTDAYVRAVADAVGVKPDDFINLHEYRRLRPLVVAIITHENGRQPYSTDVIEEGLRLAGVVNPGEKPLVAAPVTATKATAVASGLGGSVLALELVQQAAPVVDQVMPAVRQVSAVNEATQSLPVWMRVAVIVAVVGFVGASLYAWYRLRRARKAVTP